MYGQMQGYSPYAAEVLAKFRRSHKTSELFGILARIMFNAGNVRTYEYKKHSFTTLPERDKSSEDVTFTGNLDVVPDSSHFYLSVQFGSPQNGAIGSSNFSSHINLTRIRNCTKRE
jgi:hypothetical protein